MLEAAVHVDVDRAKVAAVERAVRDIPNGCVRVFPRAINRTSAWLRTRVRREVAGQLQTKVRQADRYLHTIRATPSDWFGGVMVEQTRIPLIRLATGQNAEGVTYRVPAGGTRTRPHAFFATMPSGHRGVFVRGKFVSAGARMRREVRTSQRSGRPYTTELPIVEAAEYLTDLMDLSWLDPMRAASQEQLERNIDYQVRYVIARSMPR